MSPFQVHLSPSEMGRNAKSRIIDRKPTLCAFSDFKIIFTKMETIFFSFITPNTLIYPKRCEKRPSYVKKVAKYTKKSKKVGFLDNFK